MMMYIIISFLPALLPMSLLFAVMLTYGRLSQDSEILALKATGHSPSALLYPALGLGLLVCFISAQTSFHFAPWGNRQFEILVDRIGETKAGASIREGAFSEGFFDMVVYANTVNSKTGELGKVFIYDERNPNQPVTIVAQKGQLVSDSARHSRIGLLRLEDGDIHSRTEGHTKINFKKFDHSLVSGETTEKEKTPPSLTIDEIDFLIKRNLLTAEELRTLQTEFHKRWSVAIVCVLFALLGASLGTNTQIRHQKGNNLVMSIAIVIAYWSLHVMSEGLARSGKIPVPIAIWTPNSLFFVFVLYSVKRVWN
jgi:lipopolysaccharide export system permease protein